MTTAAAAVEGEELLVLPCNTSFIYYSYFCFLLRSTAAAASDATVLNGKKKLNRQTSQEDRATGLSESKMEIPRRIPEKWPNFELNLTGSQRRSRH